MKDGEMADINLDVMPEVDLAEQVFIVMKNKIKLKMKQFGNGMREYNNTED